jgi:hypothetical protein
MLKRYKSLTHAGQNLEEELLYRVIFVPKEFRTIIFSEGEVKEALSQFSTGIGRRLPNPKLTGLQLSADGEIKAKVPSNSASDEITFLQHEIAAAMILFCTKKSIPLARRSIKSLSVADGSLSLRLVTCDRPEIPK